jgi:hypothetical protein
VANHPYVGGNAPCANEKVPKHPHVNEMAAPSPGGKTGIDEPGSTLRNAPCANEKVVNHPHVDEKAASSPGGKTGIDESGTTALCNAPCANGKVPHVDEMAAPSPGGKTGIDESGATTLGSAPCANEKVVNHLHVDEMAVPSLGGKTGTDESGNTTLCNAISNEKVANRPHADEKVLAAVNEKAVNHTYVDGPGVAAVIGLFAAIIALMTGYALCDAPCANDKVPGGKKLRSANYVCHTSASGTDLTAIAAMAPPRSDGERGEDCRPHVRGGVASYGDLSLEGGKSSRGEYGTGALHAVSVPYLPLLLFDATPCTSGKAACNYEGGPIAVEE